MRDFAGKTVVITGAAGGLGRALCRRFIAAGAKVAGMDLSVSNIEPGVLALSCDITDESSCRAAFDKIRDSLGGIDVLVNNAGISHRSLFSQTDAKVLRKVMDVNFWGSVYCTQAAVESLVERKGLIIVLSSVAGFSPLVARTGYSASKHALHGFFESLRCELLAFGVDVLMVCPSFLDTGMDARVLGARGGVVGTKKPVTGRLLGPDEAAENIFQAARRSRRLLLPGMTAKLAWWISRLAPALYEKIMTTRLAAELLPAPKSEAAAI